MDSLDRHTDYGSVPLDEDSLASNPLEQFASWLGAAEKAEVYEPNAMVLGTVDADSRPSSRTVLLKRFDKDAFYFVTNYRSTKGTQLSDNPAVSLLFPWYSLQRQVIVLGTATLATAEISDALFASRPRESQIASMASDQSRPVDSRARIEQRVADLTREFEGTAVITRPPWWGAVRVVPRSIEFWQGRTSRMHDRLRYSATPGGAWTVERLQP
ncbi:pyridoxamine 5'-phosphate oxidase [Salinibacterium sp. G-O1]|uniref:pyridoxamine 5'-phosphate oxidase n=1 Tax=Salinibacterium sp. G-O1 TaxID=3046208 RepID=UPI0024BB6CCF|nr:pyridoxamine 5'-phosphate oxidase [Salinibacterium sp. G-O1]MDJ0335868.1 pyridoxamine 5'-phosphate oxidase [Salinibacterium sp. G-O1]